MGLVGNCGCDDRAKDALCVLDPVLGGELIAGGKLTVPQAVGDLLETAPPA
jgi:hypothetical protein